MSASALMSSSTELEWPAATIRYRLNTPYVLHSISPALSALHTSRVAALHPEISAVLLPSHCPKCGAYHFSGDHTSFLLSSLTKKKRKRPKYSHPKVLERKCHVCGFSVDARTLDHSSLSNESPTTRTTPTVPQTKEIGLDSCSGGIPRPTAGNVQTTKCAPAISLPGRQSHPNTKTSTLNDMLSRNRRREEVASSQRKRREGREGLSAFLKEL